MAGNDNVFAAILSGIGMVNQAYQQNQQNQLANKELSFRERESAANRAAQQEQFDKTFQQQAEQWNKTYNIELDKYNAQKDENELARSMLVKQANQDVFVKKNIFKQIKEGKNKVLQDRLSVTDVNTIEDKWGIKSFSDDALSLAYDAESDMNKQISDMAQKRTDEFNNKLLGIQMQMANNQSANNSVKKEPYDDKKTNKGGFVFGSTVNSIPYDAKEKYAYDQLNLFKETGDKKAYYKASQMFNSLGLANKDLSEKFNQDLVNARQDRMSKIGFVASNVGGFFSGAADLVGKRYDQWNAAFRPLLESKDEAMARKEYDEDLKYISSQTSNAQYPGSLVGYKKVVK